MFFSGVKYELAIIEVKEWNEGLMV